jgi:probable phosphoglycerate mutase
VLDLDPTAEVEVRMDSKLVVEQMSGRWQIKHPDMRQLAMQAQKIARQLGGVRYTWVPRAQNGAADALANSAMDGKPVHRDPAAEAVVLENDVQPTAEPAPVVTTVTHLLRHGQTEHTPERRFSGRNELPLSLTGRAEAEAAAVRAAGLGIEVIVASPLRRTRETAEIVAAALGLPVTFDKDLVELDFGDVEGLTFDEAREKHPLAARRFMSDITVAAPGGESIVDVGTRVSRARRRILSDHAGRTVLVVSHVTPIKLFLAAGLGTGEDVVHRVFLDAASLCTVAWSSDGRTSVRSVNDTAHLR